MSDSNKAIAILVGIAKNSSELAECEISLDELSRLADTAGADTYAKVIQIKDSYDPRTLIGRGKVAEIADLAKKSEAELVIFDEELSPAQIRNLESDIECATVIDRSMLILDIFALHATSGEGKLQVELAQLKYTAPRLIGKGLELSRQGGGIGSRGPGETKLETDRRHLHEKVVSLELKLRELENTRAVMRSQRDRSGLTKVALVGYTNAGKSTVLNAITGAGVLSADKLFATLDPTTRKAQLPSGEDILLTDTVGFIRKLPHHLVKAFKSTLDEVRYADILLVVADISDPEFQNQLEVTESVIKELGAAGKPIIYVLNKFDIFPNVSFLENKKNAVEISAKTGYGIDKLLLLIEDIIRQNKKEIKLLIPYFAQSAVSDLYNGYVVKNVEYIDSGIMVEAILDERGLGIYKKYLVSES
ncbi:MAG: GTPase HflX [Ruminococcaceae bacterium]|nr:GTPase HflX [Oscillospiraceae bacterium]